MSHAPGHQTRPHPGGHHGPQEQHEQPRPGLLSQSDPEAERPTRRPPIWLIVVLLLVVGFIAFTSPAVRTSSSTQLDHL